MFVFYYHYHYHYCHHYPRCRCCIRIYCEKKYHRGSGGLRIRHSRQLPKARHGVHGDP